MEIILKKDVVNLGHADDIVNVKNGYALNYLIPQGYAILATPSAKKILAENIRQRAHKEAKLRADAEALAAKLAELDSSDSVGVQQGTTGQFYVEGDADWGFEGLPAKCVPYKNGSLAVQDMLQGKIQYVIIDAAPAAAITEAINEVQ